MYRMLIADDDEFVLDGLKNEIDWQKYNITVCECCTNGKQALAALEKQKIDIILTDIRMPGVDGLELTRVAVEQYKGIYVIIMSGHSEFEYAHTALKLGVFDYLLKPITLDTIHTLFMRLKEEMDKEAGGSKENMEQWKPTLVQKYFQDLLNGVSAFFPSELIINKVPYYQCVLFHIDHYKRLAPERQRELTSGLLAELYQWGERQEPIVPTVVRDMDLVMIFRMRDKEERKAVRERLLELKNRLNQQFSITITIGISRIYCEAEDTYFYAEEARYASRQGHVNREEKIICYGQESVGETVDMERLRRYRGLLYESFHAWNLEKAMEAVEEMKKLFTRSPVSGIEEAQLLCVEIVSKLQMVYDEYMPVKEEAWQFYRQISREFSRAETMDEMFGILENGIRQVFSNSVSPGRKNERMIRQVIQYIQDNVNTNVTLNEIAQMIYISPNYLGYLFKEEMGMSFNEYLQQYRMKLAQKLLKSHKFKVYEISAMVGYKNPSYFSKLFTEYTGGICPSDYEK